MFVDYFRRGAEASTCKRNGLLIFFVLELNTWSLEFLHFLLPTLPNPQKKVFKNWAH